ncbi:sigma 54-interacting transcriptional regulator [Shigella flexneri]
MSVWAGEGAFTGAISNRSGKCEIADNGTLLLDEIGELSIGVAGQAAEGVAVSASGRVGDDRSLRVDVRVLAATNRDLHEEVLAGRFRAICSSPEVFPLSVPPLRERAMMSFCWRGISASSVVCGWALPRGIKCRSAKFAEHSRFPGDVRELEHAIHRAVVLARATRDGDEVILEARRFAFPEVTLPPPEAAAVPVVKQNLREATEAFRRETIHKALAQNHHNWAACARMLETDVANLHRLAKHLGMKD